MKINKKGVEKCFKMISTILVLAFIGLYISYNAGYYDYGTYKTTMLTNEAIKKFENDVKEGKNISINNYVEDIKVDYGNKVSNTGLYISKKVDEVMTTSFKKVFSFVSTFVSD